MDSVLGSLHDVCWRMFPAWNGIEWMLKHACLGTDLGQIVRPLRSSLSPAGGNSSPRIWLNDGIAKVFYYHFFCQQPLEFLSQLF